MKSETLKTEKVTPKKGWQRSAIKAIPPVAGPASRMRDRSNQNRFSAYKIGDSTEISDN
jgi:hypothetical protein